MFFSGRILNSTEITKKAWSWDRSAVGEWEKIMDRVRARARARARARVCVCVCVCLGEGGGTLHRP